MDVKKIVNLTPEQYQELLETGQVEVDGIIKKKEDGVLYDTGYLEFIEWYNKIMEAQYKKVEVAHTQMQMLSLEEQYKAIVGDEEFDEGMDGDTLAYMSAIGYTAILRNGDTIKVTEPNKGIFYINGTERTTDYTYSGAGYEVVNVWCFENKDAPELNDAPTFNISELDVRNIASTPVVGDGYKNYATSIKNYNFDAKGVGTRKGVFNGSEVFQGKFSVPIEEVESDCNTIKLTGGIGEIKPHLKKVVMPELTTIDGNTGNFLHNATNPGLTYYIPNLRVIKGTSSANLSPFYSVANVVIPEKVTSMTNSICHTNKTIALKCNKAVSISSNWCYNTPSVNFTMCDDWQADINIAVAAKNHTKDWFIDLFANKLHDFSEVYDTGDGGSFFELREITIPLAIFNALTEEELAIAENKNWTVGGA